jgi:hypothetical protein
MNENPPLELMKDACGSWHAHFNPKEKEGTLFPKNCRCQLLMVVKSSNSVCSVKTKYQSSTRRWI